MAAAANELDSKLLAPTLWQIATRGLLPEIGRLHLDRGYDYPRVHELVAEYDLDAVVARRRRRGEPKLPAQPGLGIRWPVERTNSWLSNWGQLRRSTDRSRQLRQAWLELGAAAIILRRLAQNGVVV